MSQSFLEINHLTVEYFRDGHSLTAVQNVGLSLEKGKCLALVGESGCGKSTIALTVMGLLPKSQSRIASGEVFLEGKNLLALAEEEWRRLRGARIAMIFQDPFSSLNPVLTAGYQLQESVDMAGGGGRARSLELLGHVQLADPERIYHSYPHQMSGGQRQRVMIAIALARHPDLLIADEPTTALDVTVQDEVVKLLKSLQQETGMAMIFVTHNLGLVKNVADDVAVMRNGKILETGPVSSVFARPQNAYTNGLLRCTPTLKRHAGPLPTLEDLP